MKKIAILGSTGSIGTQTLDIVRANSNDLMVVALSAGSNIDLLEKQIREFHPVLVSVKKEEDAALLKERIADLKITISWGMDGLLAVATIPEAQVLVTGIVGMIGIQPTIAAIKAGKDIALANKETLVCAGHIIMPLAKQMGVSILPVDSEHSAIYQSLNGENRRRLTKILLTASGGPFRTKTIEEIRTMKLADALNHPNWAMGKKVTIDSASMVNKGLEVMEAKWLFGAELDQIQVVVHPQSIVHSAVEFEDGGIMAQLGAPDMRLPIQYALFGPDRPYLAGKRVDLFALAQLTFEAPDLERFRGLQLAYDAARAGGSLPTVFNAANEEAVALLLEEKIEFYQIPELIETLMDQHVNLNEPNVEQILSIEKETRSKARLEIEKWS